MHSSSRHLALIGTHARSLALGLVLSLAATPVPATPDTRADAEIRHLLAFVADSGCIFIRNGDPHDAGSAGEHLAMKYDKAKAKLATAEQFIEHVATSSYFTGREYRVRCPGQPEITSAVWLQRELTASRHSAGNTATPVARNFRQPRQSP